ncbi:ABC transporter ATP-binding protein [Methylobacterium nodulans]|uniref:ABC transporter related n=1 Tax=Methylobacterium nodulans (strain LMG 21967 / CNCM I-2342 / ORS 2060) TaxID=460265 RepID=B8IKN8_METNO|nr:ABC transporter ATP-binding protein [Methylobacterium nodulans]ACL56245.1 ABC transporter related [Methylobacterium nodulans ORS 2060]
MGALLDVASLRAAYGQAEVLFGVSLTLKRGEVAALMGRNGAGKSTTLKAIMGMLVPTGGSVAFEGRTVTGWEPFRIARAGLGYVPEERRIFTDLTVFENLEVGRKSPTDGRAPWSYDRLFSIFPNLAEMRGRRASAMSGGEQQMLTIARTLMGNPHAVLLDEPSEGLAPVIVEQMAEAVLRMKQEGIAVLLSEQNLGFAAAVCDRATIIEKGAIRFEGTMAELEANEAVREAYLTV